MVPHQILNLQFSYPRLPQQPKLQLPSNIHSHNNININTRPILIPSRLPNHLGQLHLTCDSHLIPQQLSSLPPLQLAEGGHPGGPAYSCKAFPEVNLKIELPGQDVIMQYSDVGKILDILLVACVKGEYGAVVGLLVGM